MKSKALIDISETIVSYAKCVAIFFGSAIVSMEIMIALINE